MNLFRSLTARLVLLASLWCLFLLAAGGVALQAIFASSVAHNFDSRLEVLVNTVIAATVVDGDTVTMREVTGEPRFDQPLSGWYWQIEKAAGAVARSRSLWDQQLGLAEQDMATIDGPQGQVLRMLTKEVEIGDDTLTFRVAGDTAELVRDRQRFARTLFVALASLGVGLVGAVLIQVLIGLQPLQRMRAELGEIRAGQRSRLDENVPAELSSLGAELNDLLQHNEDVISKARNHAGNLAHALKAPLTIMVNADADGDTALAEATRRQLPRLRRLVDHHLSRARAVGSLRHVPHRTPLEPVADAVIRTINRLHEAKNIDIVTGPLEDRLFRGEQQDLEELLGNLVDNACKFARSRVELHASSRAGWLDVVIDDDGPGLSEAERAAAGERGVRFDESVPGTGLGLAIVQDIASLYGGGLRLNESPLGGLRAQLVLPGA
ncbi:MAG: sensor histidine kinase [Geminicoccaceae bacterium]